MGCGAAPAGPHALPPPVPPVPPSLWQRVLADMELAGIAVDAQGMREMDTRIKQRMDEVRPTWRSRLQAAPCWAWPGPGLALARAGEPTYSTARTSAWTLAAAAVVDCV